MNFFSAQADARRRTLWLVGLLILATAAVIIAVSIGLALLLAVGKGGSPGQRLDPQLLGMVSLVVIMVVAGGAGFRHVQLARGGSVVAAALGGRRVFRGGIDDDPAERRLLNVVEEMALAAGLPVPEVYVLNDPAINAFAAGHTPDDAVIGVTRGALDALDRDQLQGIIAHEFSHILHGDMRLNLRLVALLHGLVVIGVIGRMLFRVGHGRRFGGASKERGGLLLFGGLLIAMGFVGSLCGSLIRSAVSRQREFLADASAVQYTRNPDGIAGALMRLAVHVPGSGLSTTRAEEFSHLFFGQGHWGFGRLSATHPPLKARIRRLLPNWDGRLPVPAASGLTPDAADRLADAVMAAQPRTQRWDSTSTTSTSGFSGEIGDAALHLHAAAGNARGGVPYASAHGETGSGPGIGIDLAAALRLPELNLERARRLLGGLDAQLLKAAEEAYSARALVFGIVMGVDPRSRGAQRQALIDQDLPEVLEELDRLTPRLTQLKPGQRLPLIELAMPALRSMSRPQLARFGACLDRLIEQEDSPGICQWALRRLVLRGLEGPQRVRHHRRLEDLAGPLSLLFSALAEASFTTPDARREALAVASQVLGVELDTLDVRPSSQELDWALGRLSYVREAALEPLLQAMCRCVEHDGVIEAQEAELVRAVAWTLGCPLSPFATETLAEPLQ